MKSDHRYQSLDAIRGIAALGVVIFHYANHFGAAPYQRTLGFLYQRGVILVDVFFVMSGYLLATIYAGRHDVKTLIWRRVARLAPLHWLMLAVVTILQLFVMKRYSINYIYQNNDAYHFLLNLLLLHCSGLSNGFSFDGPAWSISVEWLVNLMLFALLACRIKHLPLVAAGLALLAMLAQWDHGKSLLALGLYRGFIEGLLLRGVAGFFVGVALIALFPLTTPAQRSAAPVAERVAGHLWDAVLVLSAVALHRFMAVTAIATLPGVDFAVCALVIPALIVAATRGRWASKLLALPPLQWLGWISYSLYLVHFPMQAAFILVFPAPDRWLDYSRPVVLAGYVGATLLASYLTWRFVELPAQSLLQSLTIRRPEQRRLERVEARGSAREQHDERQVDA